MDVIKTDEIRQYAKQLDAERSKLVNKCTECDALVNNLNQVFNDPAYQRFSERYKNYKPTMQSLCQCLDDYVKFLNSVAENYDEFIRKATSKLQ